LIAAESAGWLAGMTELGPVDWPPGPIRTERLVLRASEARDRAAFIELLASPEAVVLTTQSANVGSMRLAAKLGFTELERFPAWDAEQWLGLRSPVTPSA
jgi:hypothetical protein